MKLPDSTTTPQLVDRAALAAHRARIHTDALFLHRTALSEVEDRLSMVNRSFTAPAVIAPFTDIWSDAFPSARVVSDDPVLDLSTGAHDLIIHAMTLHWADDPVGQIIQCQRALKPDGLFLAVCLGGSTLHQLRTALAEAEVALTGGLSPRIAPMAEIRDLGALLQRAGLALPVADSVSLTAEYRDIWHLMRDLREMGETNALSQRLRHPSRSEIFKRADAHYAQHFQSPEGRIPAAFELICLTGWAPDESQPKPLRPGSAQSRLAHALGTNETKLPD